MLIASNSVFSRGEDNLDAKDWIESGIWRNGFNVDPDVSVNIDEFKSQYEKNRELWDAMFGFLAKTDLNALAIGNHDIVKGRCWVTISEYVPRLAENVKVESHRRFIDLQYTLQGNELMGLAKNPEVLMEYNPAREVAFWTSDDISYYKAGPESFFLFFPSDIHQPSVRDDGAEEKSRKVVVKIEYVGD